MTARILPRELGVTLRCDGRRVFDNGCDAMWRSANILVLVNRREAKRYGWITGLRYAKEQRLGTRRCDFCPTCAALEQAAWIAEQNAAMERRVERDDKRRERAERWSKGAA